MHDSTTTRLLLCTATKFIYKHTHSVCFYSTNYQHRFKQQSNLYPLYLLPEKNKSETKQNISNTSTACAKTIPMVVSIPVMVVNIVEPLELATAMVGHPWHPTKHVALLIGVKYSVPGLLELLGKWSNDANYPDTQVCNLRRLRTTFRVTHYLLTRLLSIPDSGQISTSTLEKIVSVGSTPFREFTRLLKLVENHTFVGPVPVGAETLNGLFMENLVDSKPLEDLRREVDEKFNLMVVQRLKGVMDEEARVKLLQIIEGANDDLPA